MAILSPSRRSFTLWWREKFENLSFESAIIISIEEKCWCWNGKRALHSTLVEIRVCSNNYWEFSSFVCTKEKRKNEKPPDTHYLERSEDVVVGWFAWEKNSRMRADTRVFLFVWLIYTHKWVESQFNNMCRMRIFSEMCE